MDRIPKTEADIELEVLPHYLNSHNIHQYDHHNHQLQHNQSLSIENSSNSPSNSNHGYPCSYVEVPAHGFNHYATKEYAFGKYKFLCLCNVLKKFHDLPYSDLMFNIYD